MQGVIRTPWSHKLWISVLRTSSVDLTKSAENWIFGHTYWRNPYCKTSFRCSPRSWFSNFGNTLRAPGNKLINNNKGNKFVMFCAIWYHLYNFKTWKTPKECYPYYSCRLQPATLLKIALLHGCFFTFLK